MKKIFTSALVLFTVIAFAQIPNASFETWTGGAPVGWSTNNNIHSTLVTQSNDANDGASAASLVVVSNGGSTVGGSLSTSFTMNGLPMNLRGWYIANLLGGDALVVSSTVNSNSSSTHGSILLDSVKHSAVLYTRFSEGYTLYGTPHNGDSVVINLTIGNSAHAVDMSSSVIIDELSFDTVLTGVMSITENAFLEGCTPNPATNTANIIFSLTGNSDISMDLYDVTGHKVKSILDNTNLNNGEYKIPFNVGDLASGVYLYTLLVNGRPYTQKMVVAR